MRGGVLIPWEEESSFHERRSLHSMRGGVLIPGEEEFHSKRGGVLIPREEESSFHERRSPHSKRGGVLIPREEESSFQDRRSPHSRIGGVLIPWEKEPQCFTCATVAFCFLVRNVWSQEAVDEILSSDLFLADQVYQRDILFVSVVVKHNLHSVCCKFTYTFKGDYCLYKLQ